MMEERRKFVRLDTRLDMDYHVLPSGGGSYQTVSKDIGGGGICLFAQEPLLPGTPLSIRMTLPDSSEPVGFTAEVVWSESYEVVSAGERRRTVEIGVRFVKIAPQDRERILQHVILNLQTPH